MKVILVKDILKICNGKLVCGNEEEICKNFSKDTREINEGDIYLGIKGERFNGSNFYKEAFEKGFRRADIDRVEQAACRRLFRACNRGISCRGGGLFARACAIVGYKASRFFKSLRNRARCIALLSCLSLRADERFCTAPTEIG